MADEPVRVANVHRVTSAAGTECLYLRKTGYPRIPLKSAWGTLELKKEVEALIADLTPEKPQDGTLKAALDLYETKDADFLALEESTKVLYRGYLKELAEDLGDVDVVDFQPAYVLDLKNAWAPRGHRATNLVLQVLKNALKPAMVKGLIPPNTFELVGQVRRPAELDEPNIAWTMHVVSAVIERALDEKRFGVARAVAIARYVGARRGDIVGLTASARRDGRFRFLSGKKRVPVDQVEDSRLTRLLETIPAQQPPSARAGRKVKAGAPAVATTHLVFNLANMPYTESGLAQEVGKIVAALYQEGVIDSDAYGLHGLRHTRGIEAALAGCTDAQGAALLGHRSPTSFGVYRRQADRIRLADDAAKKIHALRESDEAAAANGPGTRLVNAGGNDL